MHGPTRGLGILVLLAVVVGFASASVAQPPTPQRPFSDRSPWNARPVGMTLGTEVVPKSDYYPIVAEGDYSVRVFTASPGDPPMVVRGPADGDGLWIADAEVKVPQLVIPHWPADVSPAAGGDGHADVVDIESRRIHSFWQLRFVGGAWRAAQYAWSSLDGRGWGDSAHYFQGARAAGVPTMGGLIRRHEVDDGQPLYRHALAMSMAFNGLAADPAYVYPATSADIDAKKNNHGVFPEGALMMLPADFDVATLSDERLRKVARTLQRYGAYVVDANGGTPFAIYVEIGSNFRLMRPGIWDADIAADLDRMRRGLRRVTAVESWLDAEGTRFEPVRHLNLLSMRGPWAASGASAAGTFDSWQQALVFPERQGTVTQVNASGRNLHRVHWAEPREGMAYRFAVTGSAGASLRITLFDDAGREAYNSGSVAAGKSVSFRWPRGVARPVLTASSRPGGGGTLSATLIAEDARS